jgi:tripartite-type tricarboxylate transporter receptor subunit TctC
LSGSPKIANRRRPGTTSRKSSIRLASTWYGVGAPRSTSPEIVEKLNQQLNAAVADPIIKTRLVEQGGTVFRGSPTDFEKLIAEDTAKWAKVIRGANIKPE